MHLVLALDSGFENLSVVALTSRRHHPFESVVVVFCGDPMDRLQEVARLGAVPTAGPGCGLSCRAGPGDQALFLCIEALQQRQSGRYLYVDADTHAHVFGLETFPMRCTLAAVPLVGPCPTGPWCSACRPLSYFNAGVMLLTPRLWPDQPGMVVDYYRKHRALCRFREQCALNGCCGVFNTFRASTTC